MKIKSILSYFWKLPICGILFFSGLAVSGVALPLLGFQAPELPAGTDPNTISLYFLGGSLFLGLLLSFLSVNLPDNFFVRWGLLFGLTWTVSAVVMVLESVFFMDTGAVSSAGSAVFTALNFLLPSLTLAGGVSWLFPPVSRDSALTGGLDKHNWTWKIPAALLAYPVIYILFGLIVQPLVAGYYTAGLYELEIPTWGQLVPLQLVRSLLLLAVCLPVIRHWRGSRRRLWLSLGLALFGLSAFMAVITAYWFPWQLRVFHGLELLADGLVYAGVLVWLFAAERETVSLEKASILLTILVLGILPSLLLPGCASRDKESLFPAPELTFSVTLETSPEGEIQGSTLITNQAERRFPGDGNFLGQMTLWNGNGEPRAGFKVYSLSAIEPGETQKLFTGRWQLDPGIYFLTWGSDPYGGVISAFIVSGEDSSNNPGRTWSIPTPPAREISGVESPGQITSFSQRADGTLFISGKTPLPDECCLYLMPFSSQGLLDGFPVGYCVHPVDGSWVLEVPLPDGEEWDFGPESGYRALLFSEHPSLPPSEPFQIDVSPPQSVAPALKRVNK